MTNWEMPKPSKVIQIQVKGKILYESVKAL